MATYRIELTADDNGTFLVTAPAFPEVTSFGEGRADGLQRGLCAIEEAIAARVAAGVDIPKADGDARCADVVHTPLLMDLKIDLYRAIRAAGVTRAELARRLGWKRTSVDRLFDIDHASRLEQIEAATAALGFRVDARLVSLGQLA